MQTDARLSGDAAALAREHERLLASLPATMQAFILVELQKWPVLFAPEQRYQRALLEHLARVPPAELAALAGGIVRIERDAGIARLARRDPARLQDEAQGLLRKHRLVPAWRREIDAFFQQVDPALEPVLYPPDAPRRLVLQLYGTGIAVQPGKLWSRFKDAGTRVALALDGLQGASGFLQALFGGGSQPQGGPSLFAAAAQAGTPNPLDAWVIEAHETLHEQVGADLRDGRTSSTAGPSSPAVTGLSYDRLRSYRDELMRALYKKVLSGVESPQAFAAYARSLTIAPPPGVLLEPSDAVQALVRDVFLTGNGTLFVNNTFVEWAAVQALRRAQPRVLVARYGVRDRLKPFSSMLLFSQPRASDEIPIVEDPVGSFVDVEQLSYYVWLNAEKSPAYRRRTLYLFLAEGLDEMLAIRSDQPESSRTVRGNGSAASLADVHATIAAWLNLPHAGAGQPIASLIS